MLSTLDHLTCCSTYHVRSSVCTFSYSYSTTSWWIGDSDVSTLIRRCYTSGDVMRPWLNQGDKGRQCSVEHNLENTFFVCGHKAILKFISREASWAVEDQGQDYNNYDWRTGMYLITFMSFNFKSNSSVHWNQITMQSIQDDDKTISTQLKDIWRETREWRKYWKTTRTCVRTAAAAHTCVLSKYRRWFPTGSM